MTKIKSLLLLLLVTVWWSVSYAQKPTNPATWRLSVRMVSETEGVATLKAIVNPGWHLYGTSLPRVGRSLRL